MFNENEPQNINSLVELVQKYVGLKAEGIALNLIQKLTLFIGAISVIIIGIITVAIVMMLLSIAFADFLGLYMNLYIGYLIVTAINVLVFGAIYLLRRVIIFNPLARFLSRLFFEK